MNNTFFAAVYYYSFLIYSQIRLVLLQKKQYSYSY